MWVILVSLIVGIGIGLLKLLPEKFIKYNLRFQQIGIIILLFSMGASVGANKELMLNLKSMGIKAAAFAVMTSAFSIALVYFISNRFLIKGEEK